MDRTERAILRITEKARLDLYTANLGMLYPETDDLAKLPRKEGEILSVLVTINRRLRGYASRSEARDAMWIIAGRHAVGQNVYGLEHLWYHDEIVKYFNIAR